MSLETRNYPDRPVLPMGRYPAVLHKIEVCDNIFKSSDDDDEKNWKWVFMLELPDGGEHEQWGYSGRSVGWSRDGVNHKARAWFEAVNGSKLNWPMKPDVVEPDEFYGKRCMIKLNDTNKEGKAANVIIGVEPAENGATPPKPAVNEEAGWPRRLLSARTTLRERGVTMDVIEAQELKLCDGKTFKAAASANQKACVEHMEAWTKDAEGLFDDATGDEVAF